MYSWTRRCAHRHAKTTSDMSKRCRAMPKSRLDRKNSKCKTREVLVCMSKRPWTCHNDVSVPVDMPTLLAAMAGLNTVFFFSIARWFFGMATGGILTKWQPPAPKCCKQHGKQANKQIKKKHRTKQTCCNRGPALNQTIYLQ